MQQCVDVCECEHVSKCVSVVRGSMGVGQMGQQAGEVTVGRWGRLQGQRTSDIEFLGMGTRVVGVGGRF